MSQLLSDEEITLIVRECAKGSAINRDGSTSHRIARAVIAAYEAKLREQEPVAWMYKNKITDDVYLRWTAPEESFKPTPLYAPPAPIPEGCQLAPMESTEEMLNSISPALRIVAANIYKTLLAAARSEA